MSEIGDLVAWLREQLDADTAMAQAAQDPGSNWWWDSPESPAEWNPTAVLADVAAKRALALQFELRGNATRAAIQPPIGGVWDDLLRMLASAYAHRPGYREEWRP